ncbi:MAG TPA: hypothetical protein VFQ68_34115 [Streptosporangiaceae bacterium]|nr:hypothetical protein [Streptosporangiaceae bacterium]
MRGKGVNYDTGFLPGGHDSRRWRPRLAFEAMAGLQAADRPPGGPLT